MDDESDESTEEDDVTDVSSRGCISYSIVYRCDISSELL